MFNRNKGRWEEITDNIKFSELMRETMFENFNYDSFLNKKNRIFIFVIKNKIILCAEYDIELNKLEILNGVNGSEPLPSCYQFCIELIEKLNCEINPIISKFLGIIKIKNKIFNIYRLPSHITIDDNVDLSYSKINYLPNKLKINGSLFLCVSKIKYLPSNLEIKDDLNIAYTKIKKIPNSLKVGGLIIIDKQNFYRMKIPFKFFRQIRLNTT